MWSTRSVRNASQSRGATARSAATTSVREYGRTAGERSGPPKKPPQKSSSERPYSRSEEHTSELQSHSDLVCRLLLEKKNLFSRTLVALLPRTWRQNSPPLLL